MSAAAQISEVDERFRELKGKTYIHTLLQSLVRRRVLVSIYLPGSDQQYISTVLSVDTTSETLLLDELFPLSGHPLLEKAGQLRLFAHLGGAALGFSTTLAGVEQEEGLYFFRLSLPESVNYLQRREGHRVTVLRLGIHAELYDHNGKVHKSMLHDISTGGIGLAVGQGEAGAFHKSGVYRCTLHLPGEEPFQCKLDVTSKRRSAEGATLVGGSYVGLDSRSEHAMRRVVAELERRLLRQRWEPATPQQDESAS